MIAFGGKIYKTGASFYEQQINGVNEEAAYAYDQGFIFTLGYGTPMPVASIYSVLIENEEKVQSLTLTYYKKGPNNTLVKTDPFRYDFTVGGRNSEGELLEPAEYRLYVIGQLRYLFAEQAIVSGKMDDSTGLYDLTFEQVPREQQTTNIVR